MRCKLLSLLALAAAGSAQTVNLTAALASSPQLSNLTTLLSAFPGFTAQLANATNVTLLAPSNDAFAKLANSSILSAISANDTSLIEALVLYHVVNGTYNSSQITDTPAFLPTHLTDTAFTNVTGGQRVEALSASGNVTFISGLLSTSTVSQANIGFTGGIIHVIDTFLTPPINISSSAQALGLSSAVGALEQASLVTAVDSTPDITAFIPSNAAFQAVGSAFANASASELASVLEYHVINGTVAYSTDVQNGTVPTLQGNSITLTVANGSIFVNQAQVIIPNILVANGVVHVIDGVLNPNATSVAPSPSGTVAPPAFSGATSASAVPFTSGVPAPSTTVAIPSAATGAAGGPTSAGGSGGSSASSAGAAKATQMAMGAVGAGALFAGAWMGL